MASLNFPVYAIPPSFNKIELDLKTTEKYLEYLELNLAKCIMTTAGTSQFNLIDKTELRSFNVACRNSFNGHAILGLHENHTRGILEEIEYLYSSIDSSKLKSTYIILLFPERYYNDEQLYKYFLTIADKSKFPILIHGNSMKIGSGGTYEYSGEVFSNLAIHPNIIGIKEEFSSWDLAYKTCRIIRNKNIDFNIIVAGGSQKRYVALKNAGATSFLTGIGNIWPSVDETFYTFMNNDINKANQIVIDYEEPLFEVFMRVGWHASLRHALNSKKLLNLNRDPFIELSDFTKSQINETLKTIENKILKNEDLYIRPL